MSVFRACSMSSGRVWVYLRSVMSAAPYCRAGVEWPIRYEATFGETPAASSHVAAVCRASCKVIG